MVLTYSASSEADVWRGRFHSLLTVFVLIYTANKVMDGDMKLGGFTVLLATLFQFDAQVLSIFTSLSQMANGYSVIVQIAELLNAATRRKVSNWHQ